MEHPTPHRRSRDQRPQALTVGALRHDAAYADLAIVAEGPNRSEHAIEEVRGDGTEVRARVLFLR